MKLFGLIGYPLEHSFSKKYFSQKFEKENIQNCIYRNFELEDLSNLKSIIETHQPVGLNVTIPYKTEILKYCDYLSDDVKAIQAANTLRINKQKIEAFNTDWIAFRSTLDTVAFDRSKKALVLGSGGASKAIQYALKKANIKFVVISRNADGDQLNYDNLDDFIMDSCSLIVNCSPLGTYPDIEACPDIPYNLINANHFCYDLVYNPERSMFLQKSEKRGAKIKNGLEMLILQADEAWKIWQENI